MSVWCRVHKQGGLDVSKHARARMCPVWGNDSIDDDGRFDYSKRDTINVDTLDLCCSDSCCDGPNCCYRLWDLSVRSF